SVPDVTLRCGLSFEVPQPSRRRKKVVVPAVVGAHTAFPATARYGFRFSDTDCPAFGLVIVTEMEVAAAATAVTVVSAAAAARARRHSAFFKVRLPIDAGPGRPTRRKYGIKHFHAVLTE